MQHANKPQPPIHLTALERSNGLEDLGFDFTSWVAHFEVTGKPVFQIVTFHDLWRWTKTELPEVAAYFGRVRAGIPGWGPKHSRMFAIFDDEGFDFEPLVSRFIPARYDVADILKWRQKLDTTTPAQRKELKAKLDDLTQTATDARRETDRWNAFAEALLAFATQKAIEVYPEILESGPERIKVLGHTLYDTLNGVADAVAKVAQESES